MAPQEVLAKDLAHPRHFLAIGEPTQESGLPKAKFVYHGYNEPAWQVGASTGKYPISSTAIQARSAAMTLAPEHCCPTTLVRDVVIDGSILAVQKVDDFHLCILVFQMERYSQKKWIYDNNRDTFKIDFCCTPLPKYWLHPPDQIDGKDFPLSGFCDLFRSVRLEIPRVEFYMRVKHLNPEDALLHLNALTGRIPDGAERHVYEEPCLFIGKMGDAYYKLDEFSDEEDEIEKLLADEAGRPEWEKSLNELYAILNSMEKLLRGDGQVDTPQLQNVMHQKRVALNKLQRLHWRGAQEDCLKERPLREDGQAVIPELRDFMQQKQVAPAKPRRVYWIRAGERVGQWINLPPRKD